MKILRSFSVVVMNLLPSRGSWRLLLIMPVFIHLWAAAALANTLTFTGRIDQVPDGSNLFHIGDPVMFKLTYNPATNIITRAVVSSGESDFVLYGMQGHIYIDQDPVDGSVLWQIPESENFDLALGAAAPVPCSIDDFEINDFTIWLGANICAPRFQVHGHLTSIP